MYDFSYKNSGEILKGSKESEDFLIFVKRLLPRWANGIPDSECIAIFKVLNSLRKKQKKQLVLLETGSGASTLAMFLHCALFGGTMYSWDTNASKGSFLRSVISDSIGKILKVDVNKIWNFIPFNSTDPNVGIRVLKELKRKADFCFFDSWHTLDHIMFELREFEKVSTARFVVAFDDAYYTKKHSNYSYINMLRAKLNLKKVKEPANNICKPFHIEIENYLNKKYKKVSKIKDFYKRLYKKDIFFEYFSSDRKFMNKIGMEKRNKLVHRFDAFIIE